MLISSAMIWCFWNVRDINKPFKQKEVKIELNKLIADFVALIETAVKAPKYSRFLIK